MKMYLSVTAPGNGKTYEFRAEGDMPVGIAKARMIEEIAEAENGNITLSADKAILCGVCLQKILCDGETLAAAGVKSGQNLLLL